MMIQQATVADADAIGVLFDAYRQFYAQTPDLALARAFIRARLGNGESVIFTARAATGAMMGFCQLYPTFCSVAAAPTFTLYDLYVSDAARKQGGGQALLRAAETHARSTGAVRLDLSTARDNLQAQSVYQALGWVRDTVFFTYSRAL